MRREVDEILQRQVRSLAELSKLVIETDRFDRRLWRELYEASSRLKQIVQEGKEKHPEFSNLLQDTFSSLFKPHPRLLPPEATAPSVRLNRGIMEKLMDTQDWKTLRADTVLDETSSIIATMKLSQMLVEEIENNPELKRAREKQEQAAQAEAEAARHELAGEQAEAAQARALAERLAAEVQEILERNQSVLRNVVRRAAASGQEEVEAAKALFRAWGIEDGQRQQIPVDRQLEILAKLSAPAIKRLADLIGRYRFMARAKMATKANRPVGEIHSIKRGKEIERLLPSEIARLGHPLGRYDFARRWTEGQTFQYSIRSRERLGKGPIIALLDTSSSTDRYTPDGYRVRDWIGATALALLERAQEERRAAAFIHFSGPNSPLDPIYFEPGEKDVEKRLRVATTWYGGGTDFMNPIATGVNLLYDKRFQDADLVLITDGEFDGFTDAWLREYRETRAELKYRVLGVAITPTTTHGLEKVCDRIIKVEPSDDGVSAILDELG